MNNYDTIAYKLLIKLSHFIDVCEDNNLAKECDSLRYNIHQHISKSLPSTDSVNTTSTESKSETKDELLERAYAILASESKQSPALLVTQMKIDRPLADELFEQLVNEGLVSRPNIQKTTKKKVTKKKVTQKKKEPTRDIIELIKELPEGDLELVNAPYKYLNALQPDERIEYLKSLKVSDVVSLNIVEQAVKDGADSNLAIQIAEVSGSKPIKRKDLITNIGKKGDEQGMKYAEHISKWIAVIPNGQELYDHMTKSGVNKEVLMNFKDIAVAIKTGKLEK